MSNAIEVYIRLLLPKGHGCPIWCPKPDDNTSLAYHQAGVSFGHVEESIKMVVLIHCSTSVPEQMTLSTVTESLMVLNNLFWNQVMSSTGTTIIITDHIFAASLWREDQILVTQTPLLTVPGEF